MKPWEKYRAQARPKPWEKYAPEKPVEFSAGEMVSNIPKSAVKYGKDMVDGLGMLSPYSPSDGLRVPPAFSIAQDAASGFAQKAAAGDNEHAVLADPERVQVADAIKQFYSDRYGSWDNTKATITTDPVGALADASGIATLGMSAVPQLPGKAGAFANAIRKTATALDPLNMATGATKAIVKPVAGKIANNLMAKAVKFPPGIESGRRASMIQTMLDEQIVPTQAGMDKLDNRLLKEKRVVDDLVAEATETGQRIPLDEIINVEDMKVTKGQPTNFNAGKNLKEIDRLINDYLKQFPELEDLSPRQVNDLKRDLYSEINFDRLNNSGTRIKEEVMAEIARKAKEAIEPIDPRIAETNARMGKLLELKEKLPQSANRIENRDLLGLGTLVPMAVGGQVGDAGGMLAGAAASTGMFPRVQSQAALMANAIKNASYLDLMSGPPNYVMTRQALANLGRYPSADRDPATN